MVLNQTNRFQRLDLSVEEFIDGQENENTKKKTKQFIALFYKISCLERGDEANELMTPPALNKFVSEFLITVRKKEDN